mgnify:FL=1
MTTNDPSEKLSAMFSAINEQYAAAKLRESKRREQGELFNIFNILKLQSNEVRLHSALLAELLCPNGSHGASSLFLKAFLKVIGEDEDYIKAPVAEKITERYIGKKTKTEGGIIDIIIEDGNHAIIIENKIYAPDQGNQLVRYYNYGKKKFPNGFKLLYLTLHGDDASDYSLGGKGIQPQNISYANEIIDWLEQCYELAKDRDNAKTIINQYNELVKELTGKDMDKQYIERLKEIILDKEDNQKAVGEILKMQDELMDEIIERNIWQPLKEYAESKGMKYGKDNDGAWIYKEEWKHYGIFISTENTKYWKDMFVGVSWHNEPGRANKLHKYEYKNNKLCCLRGDADCYWPYGWQHLDVCDWRYFNADKIIEGKVFNEIKSKFEEILAEIEERNLRMP